MDEGITRPFAVLWDQSFLWGLFVYDTLVRLRLPFDVINSYGIRKGALKNYKVLIVPGGWATHKKASLGEEGEREIKNFIYSGGGYLGFCGGAGLALSGENTLDMVPVKRLPLKRRLPSASGTVFIRLNDHPGCSGLPSVIKTTVWWPSQFDLDSCNRVKSVAFYESIGGDFWVSDIPVEGIDTEEIQKLESIYGINLDPSRYFLGNVAIIESEYGSGRLILSYPHLETPEDEEGNEIFRRFLLYLSARSGGNTCPDKPMHILYSSDGFREPSLKSYCIARRMLDKIRDFIRLGENHLLWFWRRPWILGWRRGVRGLEYSTLVVCIAFLEASLDKICNRDSNKSDGYWEPRLETLEKLLDDFLPLARKLLIKERLASFSSPISKIEEVDNAEIDRLRSYLFGRQMNHGGFCRRIFDILDSLLFDVILILKTYGNPIRFQKACIAFPNFST